MTHNETMAAIYIGGIVAMYGLAFAFDSVHSDKLQGKIFAAILLLVFGLGIFEILAPGGDKCGMFGCR
jgi:hypothetical protein